MTAQVETVATVELGGDERDVPVRAFVERSRLYGGSMGFRIDGGLEALVDGAWVDIDTLDASPLDLRIIDEAICNEAEADMPSEPVGVPAFWSGR